MTSIAYKLTPQHLAEGFAAANERIFGKLTASRRWYWDALRGLLLAFVAGGLLFGIMLAGEHVMGRPLDVPAMLIGLAYGTGFILLQSLWASYMRRRYSPYSPNGPTLAPHTASFKDDVLIITGPSFEYRYDWSNFEDVTLGPNVLLLWMEPGVVLVMPRAAIGDAAAEVALVENLKGKIARAKSLPQTDISGPS